MRNDTGAMQKIKMLCTLFQLDQKDLLGKVKLLLTSYHDIIWASAKETDKYQASTVEKQSKELGEALLYLYECAPTEDKQKFQEKTVRLFEAQWLKDLVNAAIRRVSAYPVSGEIYCEILSNCYLIDQPVADRFMWTTLNMEKSAFYERKKEALLMFGVALWGSEIPAMLNLLHLTHNTKKAPRLAEQ